MWAEASPERVMMKRIDNAKAGLTGKAGHRWSFRRVGGVDQVLLRNGADIANIQELDQKLWLALCMPTRGIALDPRTADLLDTDGDGRIRPPELIAALKWCVSVFNDPGCLISGGDRVELAAIRDPRILAGARRILKNLGKADADAVTMRDVASQEAIFANTRFNGDGVVPPSCAEEPAVASALADILKVNVGTKDRSGKDGVDAAGLDAFLGEAKACLDWYRRGREAPSVFPLAPEATAAASAALRAVRGKVDDFFARCRIAGFDERAAAVLNGDAAAYAPFNTQVLSASVSETAALPLARVAAEAALPLLRGLNPAWSVAMGALRENAVRPLLGGDAEALTADGWSRLLDALAAYEAWQAAKPASPAMTLGEERLQALTAPELVEAIRQLMAKDASLREENDQIGKVEKMIRYQRDLYEVLTNYVNFADFYGHTYAVFQAGSLYLDARVCHLCIDVADAARHAAMAGLSNAYLAYCDLVRNTEKRSVVAVVTDGDSQNLTVGRNGVFYDRDGRDWSATITRIVSNPISVREAFWLPYRKLVRLVEEQIAKRAQAAEAASMARMDATASTLATADQAKTPAAVPADPKKIELGAIALIGTVIGGLSALVAGFLQVLFGLGFWLPLGLLGVILLISGPSMLLAAIKLKQRNLGPILDANGWAINTRARMNPAFGAALTELARLPPGAERSLDDPYASRRFRPWRTALLLVVLAGVFYVWYAKSIRGRGPDPGMAAGQPAAEGPVVEVDNPPEG